MLDDGLSLGLEVECWLPDLSKVVPDRLSLIKEPSDLFGLVAKALSEKIASLESRGEKDAMRCRARVVSASEMDWGRLWTASADASIVPTPISLSRCDEYPFPVEIVSRIMRIGEADVKTFCDVCAALRSEPLRARTNASTGLHVHVGRYYGEGFFSFEQLVAVISAYVRFESVINARLLPLLRRRSSYCRDLTAGIADVLRERGRVARHGDDHKIVDDCVDYVREASQRIRDVDYDRVINHPYYLRKETLTAHLAGDENGKFARICHSRRDENEELPPVGAVLRELRQHQKDAEKVVVWSRNGPISLWDVLLDDDDGNEATTLECWFRAPDGVEDEASFRRCLLRDALLPTRGGAAQGLLSGALSSTTSPNKYYKLNISRIALPDRKATLEFRQFAGKDLEQTLVIWGWAKFVGSFVTSAAAAATGFDDSKYRGRTATESDLLDFVGISEDTMMIAWWRDAVNCVQEPRLEITSVKSRFSELFDDWLEKSRVAAALGDIEALIDACDAWRLVFHAASALRTVVPENDAQVWGRFSSSKAIAEQFVGGVAAALENCLDAYVRKLTAAEECSRSSGLETTSELCIHPLKEAHRSLRAVQAAVSETRGLEALPPDLRLRITGLNDLVTSLKIQLANNILEKCEKVASEISSPSTKIVPLAREEVENEEEDLISKKKNALAKAFQYMCNSLLVPRVIESSILWTGLQERGWNSERVDKLNRDVASALKHYLPPKLLYQEQPSRFRRRIALSS